MSISNLLNNVLIDLNGAPWRGICQASPTGVSLVPDYLESLAYGCKEITHPQTLRTRHNKEAGLPIQPALCVAKCAIPLHIVKKLAVRSSFPTVL